MNLEIESARITGPSSNTFSNRLRQNVAKGDESEDSDYDNNNEGGGGTTSDNIRQEEFFFNKIRSNNGLRKIKKFSLLNNVT